MSGEGELRPRIRRGERFIGGENIYPIEQETSLELPLGFSVDTASVRPRGPIAIILHAFYVDLLPEFRAYLDHIPFRADLFVTTNTEEKADIVASCFADWPLGHIKIKLVPNRGRDILPKIVGFAEVYDDYEYVLHLHTKQSLHDVSLFGWRGYLLDTLLGSPDVVRGVFACFARAPLLGMIAPQHIDYLRPWIRWVENHAVAEATAQRMGFDLPPNAPLDFPSGSMFWARSAAFRPLLDLQLSPDSFAEESGQTDGTLAHAIERLYFRICEQAGYDWIKIAPRNQLHDQRFVVNVATQAELEQFLNTAPLRLSSILASELVEPVAASPSPKPRRMLNVIWRKVLGVDATVPAGTHFAIVLLGEAVGDKRLIRSAHLATAGLPLGVSGEVISVIADPAEWSERNRALRAGFASGADVVLLICWSGLLHPGSGEAVLRMAVEHTGAVLIESSIVPDPSPRDANPENLNQSWAGGPVLAFTRTLFEATNGFAAGLQGEAAERDLSSRVLAQGFAILRCPLCLFSPAARH